MNTTHANYSASRSIPMLDVNRGNADLRESILEAFARVVDSGRFLHGPEVGELECDVAGICQTKHAIGCASGSDALLLGPAVELFDGTLTQLIHHIPSCCICKVTL